ncbi:dynein light intermediate chain [Hesseltinella vesiculosa]|uniref:Dynein light intermediate chain n=1 Tax=Hesseltinella vesiculosa TaxID=101127 RepID=A0A1X2GQV3_9FUNG|nr:dynein light intermediate chain [Hesseltinella vesiculosa]
MLSAVAAANGGIPLPSSEKDEIWSSILKGVASSKMVPTKNVLILGDSSSGKSTLIHYLKNDPGPQPAASETDQLPPSSFNVSATNTYTPMPVDALDDDVANNLALGYTYVDIQDEDNEAMARLGLYQLGISASEYLPLIKFALSVETMADCMVLLVLDWSRPGKFLESLQRWINVIDHTVNEIAKQGSNPESSWSRGKVVLEELGEKLQLYLKSYTEPTQANGFNLTASTSTSSIPSTPTSNFVPVTSTTSTTTNGMTSSNVDQVTLPLPSGCLSTNYGLPIAVVCTKTDCFTQLEHSHDFKDDQFDYIQQMLRCICMKYGAALFYTSTLRPYTFHYLRQYVLHRLLTTTTKHYPYPYKAQVVERDLVAVPSGWDSWGKIRILRDGFDCEAVNQGWDADMEALQDRQAPGAHGARGMYEDIITDAESVEQPLNATPIVTCEDEQVFLERHFDTLQRASDGPSRQGTGATVTKPSVVGPLGVSSMTLDLMRGSAERETDHLLPRTMRASGDDKKLPSPIQTSPNYGNSSAAGTAGNTLSSATTGASNEVLANFFQSLLSKKAGGSSPTTASSPTSSLLNGSLTREDTTRKPSIHRKEVHKELDRMRQSVAKP